MTTSEIEIRKEEELIYGKNSERQLSEEEAIDGKFILACQMFITVVIVVLIGGSFLLAYFLAK